MEMRVVVGDDGRRRCWWAASTDEYRTYHDTEWGFGLTDDHRLFEKLCLEGFQSGLSWLTILRKRENFRSAFADFDPVVVASYTDDDVARLLDDAGIVRHAGKIRSTINNANRALELIAEHGSLAGYFWPHADLAQRPKVELPAATEASTSLARDLKRRGWSFLGPTTVYAFMQAVGLVNDHLEGCWVARRAERQRLQARRQVLGAPATPRRRAGRS